MDLHTIYERYRGRDFGDNALAQSFYSPLLVREPDDWHSATHRIAFIGQETLGWHWTGEQAQERGEPWSYSDQNSLHDFFKEDDSIAALMDGYRLFDFAAHNPKNHRSPFWRYFRELKKAVSKDGSSASAVFTNVIRCAADTESGYNLWFAPAEDQRVYLGWQKGLLTAELQALEPTLILFVCGPNYDRYLAEEFEDLTRTPVLNFNERQAAKLQSVILPAPAYRTYHPAYLQRCAGSGLGFVPIQSILEDAALS